MDQEAKYWRDKWLDKSSENRVLKDILLDELEWINKNQLNGMISERILDKKPKYSSIQVKVKK